MRWKLAKVCRAGFVFGALCSGLVSSMPNNLLWAEAPPRVETMNGPRSLDRAITRTLARQVQQLHLTGKQIDDEISKRAFKQFVEALDPLKLYFYQSDIDQLAANETKLDDAVVQNGDITFAYETFKLFLKRVDERMEIAHKIIDETHDFSVDEMMVSDRKAAQYPKTPEEAYDRWRRQIKYSILLLKADADSGALIKKKDDEAKKDEEPKKLTDDEIRDRLHRRYKTLSTRWHQTDADELLEIFITSITSSLDPHTTYMAPKTLENFRILMGLKLEGIGAQLGSEDGYVTVSSIVPGGAADKQGELKVGDRLVSVGQGQSGDLVDVVDMKLDQVVEMIRGAAGTYVRLVVKPATGGEAKTLVIQRAKIELEDSAARGEVIEYGKKADGSPYKFGYINLPSFYMDMEGARKNLEDFRSTTRDVRAILADFREKGTDAVVLDLRRNGGGSLTEAINLTGLFIDQGPVVQVKEPDGNVQVYKDEEAGVAWDGPLVVMSSKQSASASEIFAGAIRDYHRGLVVGDPSTHGKGTVQSLMDLGQALSSRNGPQWGALKITIQQFYLPDGQSTQKEGVPADVVLPSITSQMPIGEGDLDYALDNDRVKKAEHTDYDKVDSNLLERIRANSTARIEKNEEFDRLLRQIEAYNKQKDEKFVSLNEKTFFERRKELDAESEEEKTLSGDSDSKDKIFEKNFYTDEILNVTRDYVDALAEQKQVRAG
jgi:carboxyl-terminal processing protease